MKDNKLGCLTSTGVIATLVSLFAIVGFAFFSGSQMFTAGALNSQAGDMVGGVSSHAQIKDCSACHAAIWGTETMADRCASCHTDISAQMFDVAKLHGTISHKSPTLSCRDCHPEHRGASAPLTDLGDNTFPHDTFGYSLEAHKLTSDRKPFSCTDCHQDDLTTFAPATCDSCHTQLDSTFEPAHSQTYGTDCLACHDGVDQFGSTFSHAEFDFKLDGGHADVACAKCHVDVRAPGDFASVSQDCYDCHAAKDEHDGAYGTDCGLCHNPSDWEDANFDHSLSTFKLEGQHARVKCEECHVNNTFKGTPADCYSCHKNDDEHSGKFGTDCGTCHSPSDWEEASFDHDSFQFPLTGAHEKVECESCHKNGQFDGLLTMCVSCHAEPDSHLGQFGKECDTCHSTSAWEPAEFNGEHTFPLDHGERGAASCTTCHPVGFKSYTCYGCHEHTESRIRSKHLEEGISDFQNCFECHKDGREHDD